MWAVKDRFYQIKSYVFFEEKVTSDNIWNLDRHIATEL